MLWMTQNNILLCNSNVAFATATGTTYTSTQASNFASMANYGSVRPIAAGIKWYANNASTNAPGIVLAGTFPTSMGSSAFTNVALAALAANPFFEMMPGNEAGMVVWHPDSINDLAFVNNLIGNSTFLYTTMPSVLFNGFPGGTTIYLDIIQHWEVMENPLSSTYVSPSEKPIDTQRVFGFMESILPDATTFAGVAIDSVLKYAAGKFLGRGVSMFTGTEPTTPPAAISTRDLKIRREALLDRLWKDEWVKLHQDGKDPDDDEKDDGQAALVAAAVKLALSPKPTK